MDTLWAESETRLRSSYHLVKSEDQEESSKGVYSLVALVALTLA